MKRKLALLLVVCVAVSPLWAKKDKIKFDEQAAWSYIKEMSSDAMLGRKSGQPGGIMGEEYVASKFKEWGLEPAGDKGTFFQTFTIEHRNIFQGVTFEIITDELRRNFDYRDDWRVARYSGSGHFTAELVFVGYGICAPEKNYDDYMDVDVKGKFVLLTSGTPGKLGEKLDEELEMKNRIQAAKEHGALGVIGFKHPSSQSRYFSLRADKEKYDPEFVILTAGEEVMDFVFKELKTDLRYQFQQIDKLTKPQSFHTGVSAYISVRAEFDPQRKTRNVLAKITGIDEKLNKECVIIGGHMDHLGVGPNGDVYNGANDNASGTAVVMEIARVMKLNQIQPKRTVIFAAWAGEEQGLLGSRHYADHPTHPIEQTVTYFNLDMVAHGNGIVPFRGEYYGPQIWSTIKSKLSGDIIDYVEPGRGGPGGSDHSPFLAKGVPAYAIMTKGHHFKYHHPRDDADLVDPGLLKKVGDFVLQAVNIIANEPVDFIKEQRQESYQLKYQNLINFKWNILHKTIEHRTDVKDSHVDIQLSLVEQDEELSGDDLRVSVLNKLFQAKEHINQSKGLQLFSSSREVYGAIRDGKTTVIPGLKGIGSFSDSPQWASVMAGQGICTVFVDRPYLLFDENVLSDEGMDVIRALNQSGMLFILRQANPTQVKAILKCSKDPVFLIYQNLPDEEVLEAIKKDSSGIGFILSQDTEPSEYLETIDQAVQAMGSEYVAIVNEFCLWKQDGQNKMMDVISVMIQAEYDRSDLSHLFSGTFLRILQEAAEGTS
ncbi:MAG: M20/M25/M40 family metallo-hydrolase [Candidatus Aminicenantes bacterium]|nr:M20/M25/M40 family metallo-hydrolase [Candidatus Aminicenantes bacterium]